MLSLLALLCLVFAANGQMMSGGMVAQEKSDPKAKSLACDALSVLNSQVAGGTLLRLVGIKSYSTQVVNGVIHKVEFYAAESACAAGTLHSLDCGLADPPVLKLCTVSSIERPWAPAEGRSGEGATCHDIDASEGPSSLEVMQC